MMLREIVQLSDLLPKEIADSVPAWVFTLVNIVLVLVVARVAVVVLNAISLKVIKNRIKVAADESRKRGLQTAATVIKSVIKYAVYFLAITAVVGILGLTSAMTSMLAAAGIGGLIISIGAQGVVKDLVTGIFMLFENQVAVGEYVRVGDISGVVTNVAFRTITVQGARGEINIIPNGSIGVVTNFSREAYLAIVEVGVAYEADEERAMQLMLDEAKRFADASDGAYSSPVMMGVTALGDSGVILRLSLGCKQYDAHWSVERALNKLIKQRFDAEGIEIPYNKVVVIQGKDTAAHMR